MKYIQTPPIDFRDPDINRSSSGHKFHNWITGLFLAKKFDLKYIYSPFTRDAARYEDFLGLSNGYASYDSVKEKSVVNIPTMDLCHESSTPDSTYQNSMNMIETMIDNIPDESVIIYGPNPFPGKLTQYYNLIKPEIQKLYWSVKRDIHLKYKSNKISVAVHIRRGDISKNNNADRWIEFDHYMKIINNLNSNIGNENLDIHIFSEGTVADFSIFNQENVTLQLNGSDLEALHHMCSADILVTGQSSFSIMAAYFNMNFIVYTPLKNFMHNWADMKTMKYSEIDYKRIKRKYNVS